MRLVVKFGGTSIKTASRMRAAARNVAKLAAAGNQVLVVVSAMGDTTNRLMRKGREAWAEAPFDQEYLHLLATGESQSASLMAMALSSLGCKAVAVPFDHPRFPVVAASGQSGRQFLSAGKVNDVVDVRLDEEESSSRFGALIEPLLADGTVPVFPGFFIRERDYGLVTLGRGGSDVSAFLVGRFGRADEVAIVTDVPGVLTADPRVVPGTTVVPEMDAGLLTAISHSGTQVLHPNALRYKPASARARVVHFRDVADLGAGTIITGAARTGLTVAHGSLSLLLLFGTGLAGRVGLLGEVGGFLADRGITIRALTQSDKVIGLYLAEPDAREALPALHDRFVGHGRPFTEVVRRGPVAELRLSNPAFIDAPGVIGAVADSLARNGINIVEMVTSHADILVYCRYQDVEAARAVLTSRLGLD